MNDDVLARLEGKIDKQGEHLASIDVTLVQQHASLAEHMRRSDASEARLTLVETALQPLKDAAAHKAFLWRLLKGMVVTAGTLATIAEAVRMMGLHR